MRDQRREGAAAGGCIINMSSVGGVLAAPSLAAYNASKGAVDNLTRCPHPPPFLPPWCL